MKRVIKAICFVLAILMAAPISVFAAIKEPDAEQTSSFFVCYDSWIHKQNDLTFDICYDITAKRTMDELGVRVIKVQRSDDGVTGWSTRKTFTPDVYTQMILENAFSNMDYVTYTGSYGHYYRAYLEYYAKDSMGTGVLYDYTPVIYIPPKT